MLRKSTIYATGGLTNVDFFTRKRNGIDHAFLTTDGLLSVFIFSSHLNLTELV